MVDIEGGNLKIILGLIWTLILHYQLSRTRKGAKPADAGSATASSASQQLLSYVQGKCTPSGVVAADFADSFRDGRVISALTNSLAPERHLIDLTKLVSATVSNAVCHCRCRFGAIKQPLAPPIHCDRGDHPRIAADSSACVLCSPYLYRAMHKMQSSMQ